MSYQPRTLGSITIGIIATMMVFLGGCGTSTVEDNTGSGQNISFSYYTMQIPSYYTTGSVGNFVDSRIVHKITRIYNSVHGDGFFDNIVISSDNLAPNASLEDYVQAGIGGMDSTRGQYSSLDFQKNSIICSALTIPIITNTFSIYRIIPTTNSSETLYFVQTYLHRASDITTISASTSNQDNVTILQQMMKTISCNFAKNL